MPTQVLKSLQALGESFVVDRGSIPLPEEERRKQVWESLYWAEVERMGEETPHALWLKTQFAPKGSHA